MLPHRPAPVLSIDEVGGPVFQQRFNQHQAFVRSHGNMNNNTSNYNNKINNSMNNINFNQEIEGGDRGGDRGGGGGMNDAVDMDGSSVGLGLLPSGGGLDSSFSVRGQSEGEIEIDRDR